MKIKTITCHDVYNVGASLQAYALAFYLKKLGHDVEIIDYKPDYLNNHFLLFGVNNPRYNKPVLREIYQILKFPGRLKARFSKRKREYDSFTELYLPRTGKRYHSNDELKRNPPEADVYFAGSDQIWNTLFQNGKDPAFYLDFAPSGTVRASYAASFSTKDIAEKWKPAIKNWLSVLDFISVREASGVDIVNGIGICGAVHVLDPVFLLNATEWEQIQLTTIQKDPYLLVYDFDNNEQIKTFAETMALKNGWKIYSVLHCNYADCCFDQEGPQVFISLVSNAKYVISNSFHATAFSLIFHKQFAVFKRTESINERMMDLLKTVELEERLLSNHQDIIKQEKIDYTIIEERLSKKIADSKLYIDKVLKGAKKKNEKENTICS